MLHQFELFDSYFSLDANSGNLYMTDKSGAQAIKLYENNSKEECIRLLLDSNDCETSKDDIEQFLHQLQELKDEGKLYSPDILPYIKKPNKKDKPLKALCLNVAHSCNLCCNYCFAAAGSFTDEQPLMPLSVGKAAIDFLIESSKGRYNLDVDFFGGEPLLNIDVVKGIVEYSRSLEKTHQKHFRFTFTTNGVLLNDDIIEYLNNNMDNVVLSLDGRKEVHDYFRKTPNGKGSYDIVVPKFQKFAKIRGDKEYYIRATFTRHNLDFFSDILHMLSLGFNELSMEPVVTSPDSPEAIRETDLPQIFEQYELLAKEMIERHKNGKPFGFYHYNISLDNGPCLYKLLSGCGTGCEYMAVTPRGELYPCHRFVGDERFLLGNVFEGITNTVMVKEFAENCLLSHKECKQCWAKYFCAGGCAANNFEASGCISGIYAIGCEMFKKRIECALAVKALCAD
ncbi:MAG: thioether cross-link-forming SCIFF peptide maturase [Christensenellales bacterium]|jgi:uncharacterized protein